MRGRTFFGGLTDELKNLNERTKWLWSSQKKKKHFIKQQ